MCPTLVKATPIFSRKPFLSILAILLLSLWPVRVETMGMGDGGSGQTSACTPDFPLVIYPGPIGSPVRIVAFEAQSYLVADYTRGQLLRLEQTGDLRPFIETMGKPLSIALNETFKRNGKLREADIFVGNDSNRTIDVYHQDKAKSVVLIGSHRIGAEGVQALDMAFDRTLNRLYVVDGLDREIKVVQPDGQLLRSFGAGILSDPKAIALDVTGGEIYVSDYGDPVVSPIIPASIKVFDMAGNLIRTISGAGRFSRPQGLALRGDKVYLTDSMLAQVLEFNRVTGVKTATFGCRGSSAGHLLLPMDVVFGDAGQSLYVADNRNMRVTVLPLTQP